MTRGLSSRPAVPGPLGYKAGVTRTPRPATPPPTPHELTPGQVFGPPSPGEDPLLGELAEVGLAAAVAAAAFAAGQIRTERTEVGTKSSATDMVSEVDRASETLITGVLTERRPDDGLLGEEGADRPGTTGVRWVVDPLDGTTNYLFGLPSWSVSVAAEIDGRLVVGVVVDPSHTETWAAVEGRGARCNGSPCRVAEARSALPRALVATGFGYDARRRAHQAEVLRSVLPAVRDIRRFGSAAIDLCWVAGGRYDAFYELGLEAWDAAAGTLICREAGGVVETLGSGVLVASTPGLAEPLRELLLAAGA